MWGIPLRGGGGGPGVVGWLATSRSESVEPDGEGGGQRERGRVYYSLESREDELRLWLEVDGYGVLLDTDRGVT